MGCDQQHNNRYCALFSIANATELAFKGPWYSNGCFHNRRCLPVYMLCGIYMDPINWTGLPTIDLFSKRNDKVRSKTHSTSSRCSVCKLNTVER